MAKKIAHYNKTKETLSYSTISNNLTKLKKTKNHKWLTEADSQALQQALKDLEQAYQNFFKHSRGFPKFKDKNTYN